MADLGTKKADPSEEELSKIIDILNEKFKTDFTPSDELFLDSIREDAIMDQKVRDAAQVNTIDNFEYVFSQRVDDLFVDRIEQNEAIASRFLNDSEFRNVVSTFLLKQVYEKIRGEFAIEKG